MAVGDFYGNSNLKAYGGLITWGTSVKVGLLTSAYTPNRDTNVFWSDVNGSEVAVVSTTLASSASAGATSVSSTASVAVGNAITVGSGATQESHLTTAVSGSGPYTLTLADTLVNAQASGATLTSSTGYTANGVALTSPTNTYTAANSWSTQWAASTAYATAAVVRPTTGNGYLYRATAAGTSGSSAPTWPTVIGATVVDSGVTWTCIGNGVTLLSASNPSWSASGGALGGRYAVFYYSTGTASTSPLIGVVDQGQSVMAVGGSFTIQVDPSISAFFPLFSS
jgi:hypothetical protein